MPAGGPIFLKVGVYIEIFDFLGVYIEKFYENAPNIDMMKCWAEIY